MNTAIARLGQLTDKELLSRLDGLASEDRRLGACIVAHLAEVEMRRLHLDCGHSSLYAYATERLGFSEAMAYKRTRAAKLAIEFPEIVGHLESGALTLTGLLVLSPHLEEGTGSELIGEALGMSKRQVEHLVARRNSPRGETFGRVKLELWVSEETLAMFEKARDLDRHLDPSGDSSELLARMAQGYIEKREKERFAVTKRPRSTSPGRKRSTSPERKKDGISAATKREVYDRDGKRCTFVGPDGTRCSSTAFLEIDHAVPRALGGGHEVGNLRLLCRPHNGRAAEQLLGAERVVRAKMVADAKRGLVNLGFSRLEAENAVGRGVGDKLEDVVRSALRSLKPS